LCVVLRLEHPAGANVAESVDAEAGFALAQHPVLLSLAPCAPMPARLVPRTAVLLSLMVTSRVLRRSRLKPQDRSECA
jgi:hypothetical protein